MFRALNYSKLADIRVSKEMTELAYLVQGFRKDCAKASRESCQYFCGFRKGFNSQYASSSLQEKEMKEKNIDNNVGRY